jgi:hypothetical protein
VANRIEQANQYRLYVIYGGGPDLLRGSGPHTSALEVWNLFYSADVALLESTWFGASEEKVEVLRQRVVALRTLAGAYEAQMRSPVRRRQFFESSQRISQYSRTCFQTMASAILQSFLAAAESRIC